MVRFHNGNGYNTWLLQRSSSTIHTRPGVLKLKKVYKETDYDATSFMRSQPSSSSTIVLSLCFPCLFEDLIGRSRVGLAVVACNNCWKSRGKVSGVGGGKTGVVACERLKKERMCVRSKGKETNHLYSPSQVVTAANRPKITEDVTSLGQGDINGLRICEVADIVQQHRKCSCKRLI